MLKKIPFLSLVVILVWAFNPTKSFAATFCVDGPDDNATITTTDCDANCDPGGNCSLRDAIEAADTGGDASDIIIFSPSLSSPYTILAGNLLPTVDKNVQINGPGPNLLTIDGSNNSSNNVFHIDGDVANLALGVSGLTISGGAAGISFTDGNLVIDNCVITGNKIGVQAEGDATTDVEDNLTITNTTISNNTSTIAGAGLRFRGHLLTIQDSTISGNESDLDGGGISMFPGSDNNKAIQANLTNVTISGNKAGSSGGGMDIEDNGVDPLQVTLTNVTIANNTADSTNSGGEFGGGIFGATTVASPLTLRNTLIANNSVGSGSSSPDCSDSVVSNGFNLVRDPAGCGGLAGSDITGQNPLLAGLALNAPGTTETQALSAGSPAIDGGDNASCPGTDQRGVARPQGPDCDIGAFEAVICGDGSTGSGEECDGGSCCSSTCQFEPSGTACDNGGQCNATGDCIGGGGGGGGCRLETADVAGGSAVMFLLGMAMAGLVVVRRRG